MLLFLIMMIYITEITASFSRGIDCFLVQWKKTGGLKQKHKKQPFNDASASHLSLVLWHV